MKLINKPYYQERFLRYLLSPSNYGNKDVQDLIGALKQYVVQQLIALTQCQDFLKA